MAERPSGRHPLWKLWPLVEAARKRARAKRARLFRSQMSIGVETTVLDLGGGEGAHIAFLLDGTNYRPENVCISDISEKDLALAAERGFPTVKLDGSRELPFDFKQFDIVFCNSVIEHVGLPGDRSWNVSSGKEFELVCRAAQRDLAAEIKRIGHGYFVQTPDRYFPLEPHTLIPFAAQLPRPLLLKAIRLGNRYWIKFTDPDFCPLDSRDVATLFPEATIFHERMVGLSKSLMAVKPPHQ